MKKGPVVEGINFDESLMYFLVGEVANGQRNLVVDSALHWGLVLSSF